MRHALVLVFACLSVPAPALAAQSLGQAIAHRIGDATVQIPAPPDFVDPTARVPQMNRTFEQATMKAKRFLVAFVMEADVNLAASGGFPDLHRYFVAQTYRQGEAVTMSQQSFELTKKITRENYEQLVPLTRPVLDEIAADVSHRLASETNNSTLSIGVGEVRALGIFDESPNSISFTNLTKYVLSSKGKDTEVPLVISVTTALVKGKVVYLQVCSDFVSDADIQWTQNAARTWLRAISDAN